ncbi:MAG: hemerythrin domain-containing protein [Myxococcota bacterium]
MDLLDSLRAEHQLIERVVGSLRTWAEAFAQGNAPPADGRAFLRFFRLFAGDFHHAREELQLCVALVKECGLPEARGPVFVVKAEHAEMAEQLSALEAALGAADGATVARVAKAYAHALWHHIDAENSVLFPESESRLVRDGVHQLPGRAPTAAELAAKQEGEALLERYPPFDDREVFRGDGCIMCPAYGVRCNGLEREWWTATEWEENLERMSNASD